MSAHKLRFRTWRYPNETYEILILEDDEHNIRVHVSEDMLTGFKEHPNIVLGMTARNMMNAWEKEHYPVPWALRKRVLGWYGIALQERLSAELDSEVIG